MPNSEFMIPDSLRLQVQFVQRHVPVRVEDLEAALLLPEELRAVRIQSLLNLLLTRRCAERGFVLEYDLDREGPVGAAVAVVTRHEGLHRHDSAALDLLAQDRQVVAREQVLEFLLEPPFHAIEVPDRLGVARTLACGRLRMAGQRDEQQRREEQSRPHGAHSGLMNRYNES